MRVVAILLAMLAVSTMMGSAQCVVRCSETPKRSSCHGHTPSPVPAKQPVCDSLMVSGEALTPRVAAPLLDPGFTAGVVSLDGPPPAAVWSTTSIRLWDAPPPFLSASPLLALRI